MSNNRDNTLHVMDKLTSSFGPFRLVHVIQFLHWQCQEGTYPELRQFISEPAVRTQQQQKCQRLQCSVA